MRDPRSCPTGKWSCTLMRCDDDRWCVAMHARCTSSCNTCRVSCRSRRRAAPSYLIDEILQMPVYPSTEATLLKARLMKLPISSQSIGYRIHIDSSGNKTTRSFILNSFLTIFWRFFSKILNTRRIIFFQREREIYMIISCQICLIN